MNDSCHHRRTKRSKQLLSSFNDTSLSQPAFKDDKDFTVQVKTNCQNNRVYSKGLKCCVRPRRSFNKENKFSVKVMVSPAISWKGVILSFFPGEKRLKRSENLYLEHLQNEMIAPLEELFPNNVSIFIQDRAPSYIARKKYGVFSGPYFPIF